MLLHSRRWQSWLFEGHIQQPVSHAFKYDLSVLAIKRRLHSKMVRLMDFYQFVDSCKDICKFFKRVLDLAKVEHAHIHIAGAF